MAIQTQQETHTIVGIRFRRSRKMYLAEAGSAELSIGDYAVIQTSTGPELAKVVMTATEGSKAGTQGRTVVRRGTQIDVQSLHTQVNQEVAARMEFFRVAATQGLEASAVHADFNYNGTRLTFRFRCDEPNASTILRRDLEKKYPGLKLILRNLGARRNTQQGACGGGSCSTCPSNGLIDRSGATVPAAGLAYPGQFSNTQSHPQLSIN